METIKLELDTDSSIELSISKIKEFINYLQIDEVLDAIEETDNNIKIDAIFTRLQGEYPDKFSSLFYKFIEESEYYNFTDIQMIELEDDINKFLDQ